MFCLVMSIKMGNLPQSPWENQAKCANTGTVVSACECHYHGLQKKKKNQFYFNVFIPPENFYLQGDQPQLTIIRKH